MRNFVISEENRQATLPERERMKKLVAEAMKQGTLGLSSALHYALDRFAPTDELVVLAIVAASYGSVYLTQQRSEENQIFESLKEAFAIAEKAQIPAAI